MKYIIYSNMGLPTPVVFPDHVDHISAASICGIRNVESAGFVEFNPVRTTGHSTSLDKSSRPEDAAYIESMLKLSGMDRSESFEVVPKIAQEVR